MKRLFMGWPLVAAAAAMLAACTTPEPATPDWNVDPPSVSVHDAVISVSNVQEDVQRGILEAPPQTLSRTTIDERFIRAAFLSFDAALTVIDSLIDAGVIVPNTPRALTIRRYVLETDGWLKAASAAQRAGNARDYGSAFREAARTLGLVRNALVNGG